jgi:hypothetical protein
MNHHTFGFPRARAGFGIDQFGFSFWFLDYE